MAFKILIIDAYEAHRKVMAGFLGHIRSDAEIHQFDPAVSGKPPANFDWAAYKLIVMDSKLGKENGLEWFEHYSSTVKDFPPVMFLSSQNSVDIAVQAMKLGAQDFIAKKSIKQRRLKKTVLDILADIQPRSDILPNLKPLPEHHETMQYAAAETQVLQGSVRDKAKAAAEAAATVVEEVEEEEDSYWAEQTQILHEPPKF